MSLHPLDDRIVVRPGESEETTASGLVIPDTAKEKPQQGEVLAVGPGRRGGAFTRFASLLEIYGPGTRGRSCPSASGPLSLALSTREC